MRSSASIWLLLAFVMFGCGRDPGALQGDWQIEGDGSAPLRMSFRSGEAEAAGVVVKVSYKTDGDDVFVTTEGGPLKGATQRYVVVDRDTLRAEFGVLQRVR